MRYQMPPLPPSIRPLTSEEGARVDARRGTDRPFTPENCVTCRGQGSFRWWNETRTEVVEWECNCVDQWVLHRYLLAAGVELNFQRLAWADLATPSESLQIVKWWIEHSDETLNRGLGMVLSGGFGTGKSLLASLTLKALLGQGHDGFMATYSQIMDLLMHSWHDENDRNWFMRRVRNVAVLVIDDLGRERRGQRMVSSEEAERTGGNRGMTTYSLPMAENTLEEIIRHRVASARPTIITTNLTLEQMKAGYGGNSMSLLTESTLFCPFTGSDFRSDAQRILMDEIMGDLKRPVVLG